MATRRELTAAVGQRYREASRAEKARILDEFVVVTGFHRKHAMRLLRGDIGQSSVRRTAPQKGPVRAAGAYDRVNRDTRIAPYRWVYPDEERLLKEAAN
jgi:hypothetical protein